MHSFLEALSTLIVSLGVTVLLLGAGRGLEGLTQRRARTQPIPTAELEREAPGEVSPGLERTAQRVLAAVRTHPKGIRLVDIGKTIKIDWHLLIAPVNLLLQRGLIRKRERLYFPAR